MRTSLEVDDSRSPLERTQLQKIRPVLIVVVTCLLTQTLLHVINTLAGQKVWTASKVEKKLTMEDIAKIMEGVRGGGRGAPYPGGLPHHSGPAAGGSDGPDGHSGGHHPPKRPHINPFNHSGVGDDGECAEYSFTGLGIPRNGGEAFKRLFHIYETDFLKFYVMKGAPVIFAEFDLSQISGEHGTQHSDPLTFGIGAIFTRGPFAHFDATDSGGVSLTAHISKGHGHVDILQPRLWLKTGQKEHEPLASEALDRGLLASLQIIGLRHKEVEGSGGKTKCKTTHVLVHAEEMFAAGLFVVNPKMLGMMHRPVLLPTIKAFPQNMDFTIDYSDGVPVAEDVDEQLKAYRQMAEGVTIRYCIYRLDKEVMPTRLADDRVGYFHQTFHLLGDYREDEEFKGYRKEDLIDPVVDIIQRQWPRAEENYEIKYYVDYTVPKAYREATRQGILMWQDAFSEIHDGDYKPKIVALVPGDNDFPEDYDPADIRFNSISWATGDAENIFAIGQSVVDPRSGQVLKANIVFTLGWLQSWLGRVLFLHGGVPAVASGSTDMSDAQARMLNMHSSLDGPFLHDLKSTDIFVENASANLPRWLPQESKNWPCLHHGSSLHQRHPFESLMCRALYDHTAHLWLNADSVDPDAIQKYLEAGIRDITVHEVGHTLGLRHNFRGSTSYSLKDLDDSEFVKENGLGSSVMDYYPSNTRSSKYLNGNENQPEPFPSKVGAYDKWAIKYGYSRVDDEHCCAKNEAVVAIAETEHPEFSFATDYDARGNGVDPYTALFDLGKEPSEYFEDRLQLLKEAQSYFFERAVKKGEAFARVKNAQNKLLYGIVSACSAMASYLGGLRLSRNHAAKDCPKDPTGDDSCLGTGAPKPVERIDLDLHSKVLDDLLNVITSTVGSDDSIFGSLDLQSFSIGVGREIYSVVHLPYLSEVEMVKTFLLKYILGGSRLNRIQEYYQEKGPFDELTNFFKKIHLAILGISGSKDDPLPDPFREDYSLQYAYVTILADLGNCASGGDCPNDIVATVVGGEIIQLKSAFEELKKGACKADEQGRFDGQPRQCAFFTRALAKLETVTQFNTMQLSLSLGLR